LDTGFIFFLKSDEFIMNFLSLKHFLKKKKGWDNLALTHGML